jgi:hypothetical protein
MSDALESEKQINELKRALVSIASHELRGSEDLLSLSNIKKYIRCDWYHGT